MSDSKAKCERCLNRPAGEWCARISARSATLELFLPIKLAAVYYEHCCAMATVTPGVRR